MLLADYNPTDHRVAGAKSGGDCDPRVAQQCLRRITIRRATVWLAPKAAGMVIPA